MSVVQKILSGPENRRVKLFLMLPGDVRKNGFLKLQLIILTFEEQ